MRDARRDTAPLRLMACANVDDGGHQSSVNWQDMLREYLFLNKDEMVSAFASEKFLRICLPEVSEAIREASREVTIEDLMQFNIMMNQTLKRSARATLETSSALTWNDPLLLSLIIKRVRELRAGLDFFYMKWQEEKERGDVLQLQLEEKENWLNFFKAQLAREAYAREKLCPAIIEAFNPLRCMRPIRAIPALDSAKDVKLPVQTTNSGISTRQNAEPPPRKPDGNDGSRAAIDR